MNNIQIFKHKMFGEIRTITDEKGETFFVGNDVAKALGYSDVRKAIRVHVDSEDKGVDEMATPGGAQKVIIINESGLYSLILSSKLPQAKAFKHWVTSEVLPQIRRTGGYIPTRDKDGRRLSDDEIVERAYEIVGRTLESINDVNANCLTATQVARLWGMDVLSFNNLLAGMGIQHRQGGGKEGGGAGMLSAEEYEYYDCGTVATTCKGDCFGDARQEESETGADDRWNRGFHQEADKSMK